MDDKNELNDLLLGNQKESSSSKKFFLIAAGVLLIFFIIIGIMKFMGSSETKQPLPITATEQIKQIPEVAPTTSNDVNALETPLDANATADEKLNAIVKKLQQDAQSQATPQAEQVLAATANAPVVNQKPVAPPKQEPIAPAPIASPKTNVVSVPIKTASPQATATLQQKPQEVKKEDVKTAFRDATKNVAKQKAEPKVKQTTTATKTPGTYFVQVGYFESEAAAKGLREKANSIGFGSTTKSAVKNDKNVTKVWVGPFDSKEDAAKALPKIRGQIKSDAFIVKG